MSTHTTVFRRYIANIDAFNLHLVYDLDIIGEIEKGESRVSERERGLINKNLFRNHVLRNLPNSFV